HPSSDRPTAAGGPDPAHQAWEYRLQDWLDGELPAAEEPLLLAHLEHCTECREQLEVWQGVDEQLQTALPPLTLGAEFDTRLLAQIDAVDERERRLLMQRLEQEHDLQREALLRRWRRSLVLVVPGMLGGLALALSLASWLDDSGATGALAQSAAGLSVGHASWTDSALTAVLGAAIGAALAPWLARLAE